MNITPHPYAVPRGRPTFFGRRAIFERAGGELSKPTPSHVSIVGPKGSGKTMLLDALACHFQKPGSPFQTVVHWELRDDTPETDDQFIVTMSAKIADVMCTTDPDIADYLKAAPRDLKTAFDLMRESSHQLLILLDDHDEALNQVQITQRLWSQMEKLANNPSVSFVAASRAPLADLGYSPEVRTSPYWRKYDPTGVVA